MELHFYSNSKIICGGDWGVGLKKMYFYALNFKS
jgi:hypothetical protein